MQSILGVLICSLFALPELQICLNQLEIHFLDCKIAVVASSYPFALTNLSRGGHPMS
jgi:hypothetical protein